MDFFTLGFGFLDGILYIKQIFVIENRIIIVGTHSAPPSKRNVIFINIRRNWRTGCGVVIGRIRTACYSGHRRGVTARLGLTASSVVLTAVVRQSVGLLRSAIHKLNRFCHNAYLVAFFAVFCLIFTLLELSCNNNRRTFVQKLVAVCSLLAKYLNANEQRFLALVSVVVGELPAMSNSEVAYFCAAWQILILGIVDKIASYKSLIYHGVTQPFPVDVSSI